MSRFIRNLLFVACLCLLGVVLIEYTPLAPLRLMMVIGLILLHVGVSMVRPDWGLLSLAFLLPLLNNTLATRYLNGLPPAAVLVLSFSTGSLLHQFFRPDPATRRPTALDVPLLAFLLLGLGSGLITLLRYAQFYPFVGDRFRYVTVNVLEESSDQAMGDVFSLMLVLLAGPAVFWAARGWLNRPRLVRNCLIALALGLVPAFGFGLYQAHGHLQLGNFEHFIVRGRINATFLEPNALGCFCLLALPALGALFCLLKRRWAKGAVVLLALTGLHVLSLSGSRTGVLGLALAIVIAVPLYLNQALPARRRKFVTLLIVGALLAGGLAGLAVQHYRGSEHRSLVVERLLEVPRMICKEGLIKTLKYERFRAWMEGARIIRRYPVAGIGLGSYLTELPNFLQFDQRPAYRDNTNNEYLQIWAEMGGIGLALLLIVLGVVVYGAWRWTTRLDPRDRPRLAMASLITGSLVSLIIMFMTGPHDRSAEVQVLFWLLIAIVFAAAEMDDESEEKPAGAPLAAAAAPAWSTRRPFVAPALGLMVLAGLLLQCRNALTTLSVPSRQRELNWQAAEGFYPTGPRGNGGPRTRWARPDCRIWLPPGHTQVRTLMQISHPDTAEHPVTVEVLIDGHKVSEEKFVKVGEMKHVTIDLPATRDKPVELRLRTSRPYLPARDAPDSGERRVLGVYLTEFELSDAPHPPATSP